MVAFQINLKISKEIHLKKQNLSHCVVIGVKKNHQKNLGIDEQKVTREKPHANNHKEIDEEPQAQ